jgi:hypothetical protein
MKPLKKVLPWKQLVQSVQFVGNIKRSWKSNEKYESYVSGYYTMLHSKGTLKREIKLLGMSSLIFVFIQLIFLLIHSLMTSYPLCLID